MDTTLVAIALGLAASMSLGGIAVAEDLQEVVVTGKGALVTTPAGKTASGVPVIDMSVSYGVSYAGLDLASSAGAAELEKRVQDAAKDACKDLTGKSPIPQFTTTELQCTKAATDQAMVRVHELVAAAAKRPSK